MNTITNNNLNNEHDERLQLKKPLDEHDEPLDEHDEFNDDITVHPFYPVIRPFIFLNKIGTIITTSLARLWIFLNKIGTMITTGLARLWIFCRRNTDMILNHVICILLLLIILQEIEIEIDTSEMES